RRSTRLRHLALFPLPSESSHRPAGVFWSESFGKLMEIHTVDVPLLPKRRRGTQSLPTACAQAMEIVRSPPQERILRSSFAANSLASLPSSGHMLIPAQPAPFFTFPPSDT
ncbi:unnamed protein product, partial [Pleuronectes platessa]